MQNLRSIVAQPILAAVLLSVAAHAAIWYSQGAYAPAKSRAQTGRTVVQLTLLPSVPAEAAATEPVETSASREEAVPLMPIPAPNMTPPASEPMLANPEQAPVSKTVQAPSPDQDATREKKKGVTTDATAGSSFKPEYPRISRRRGEEGRVTLAVQVLPDGTAGTIRVLHSSGHRRLDNAAISAARQTDFTPARRHGDPVESTLELSYTYRLTDD